MASEEVERENEIPHLPSCPNENRASLRTQDSPSSTQIIFRNLGVPVIPTIGRVPLLVAVFYGCESRKLPLLYLGKWGLWPTPWIKMYKR